MRRRQFNSGALLALALGAAAPSVALAQASSSSSNAPAKPAPKPASKPAPRSAPKPAPKPKPSPAAAQANAKASAKTTGKPKAAQPADERANPVKAVRQLLERSGAETVAELSRPDGFAGNPKVRIGLPLQMAETVRFRRAIGRGQQFDELELALNRVAEQSVEAAGPPLRSLLQSLVVTEPARLIAGPPTAITDWFASKVRAPLINQMLGPVSSAAEQAGLARQMSDALAGAPVASVFKGEDGGLSRYLARKVVQAVFEGMAAQEQRLRADPASHPDALLRRTFAPSTPALAPSR